MSKHTCHWTRNDLHKVADKLYNSCVRIEHVIMLDMLNVSDNPFNDPLDDVFEYLEESELITIFGEKAGKKLSAALRYYDADNKEFRNEVLVILGGFLVVGYHRLPDENGMRFDGQGNVLSYGMSSFQRRRVAWAPCLHTAIGKVLSMSAKETREIINRARENY